MPRIEPPQALHGRLRPDHPATSVGIRGQKLDDKRLREPRGPVMPRKPLDKLIDEIYDAAVEPQLWDRVLIDIADMLSSTTAARRTRWYREVITPQDVEHALLMHLDAQNSINYILAVQRSVRKGSCTKEEAKPLEPLVPHLRRALRI